MSKTTQDNLTTTKDPSSEENQTTEEQTKINDDVLKTIGPRLIVEKTMSDPICIHVATRWDDIIKQSLPKEEFDIMFKKYPPPKNCTFIDPPKLNPGIVTILKPKQELVIKRDERIARKQQKLATASGAIAKPLSEVLKTEEVNLTLVQLLSDFGSLLADLNHDETCIRKNLILSNLNASFRDTLNATTPDEFLFGKNLEESVKTQKLIE